MPTHGLTVSRKPLGAPKLKRETAPNCRLLVGFLEAAERPCPNSSCCQAGESQTFSQFPNSYGCGCLRPPLAIAGPATPSHRGVSSKREACCLKTNPTGSYQRIFSRRMALSGKSLLAVSSCQFPFGSGLITFPFGAAH